MNDKQFSTNVTKAFAVVGKGFTAVQQVIDAALLYAVERQEAGHGADFRRLSTIHVIAISTKGINSERVADYIKASVIDINGASAIGWNVKEQQFKLLKKGTVVSVPSVETRGNWFDYGKPQAQKDDFNFDKLFSAFLTKVEKNADKLTPEQAALVSSIRANRTSIRMGDTEAGVATAPQMLVQAADPASF